MLGNCSAICLIADNLNYNRRNLGAIAPLPLTSFLPHHVEYGSVDEQPRTGLHGPPDKHLEPDIVGGRHAQPAHVRTMSVNIGRQW